MSTKGKKQNMVDDFDQYDEAQCSGDDVMYDRDMYLYEADDGVNFNDSINEYEEEFKIPESKFNKSFASILGRKQVISVDEDEYEDNNDYKKALYAFCMKFRGSYVPSPTEEEIRLEYYRFLDNERIRERNQKYENALASIILKGWRTQREVRKRKDEAELIRQRQNRVSNWFLKARRDKRPIFRQGLPPLRDWIYDEQLMIIHQAVFDELKRFFSNKMDKENSKRRAEFVSMRMKEIRKEAESRRKSKSKDFCLSNTGVKKRYRKTGDFLTLREQEKHKAQIKWREDCIKAQEEKALEPDVRIIEHDIDIDSIPLIPEELEIYQQEIDKENEQMEILTKKTLEIIEAREKLEEEEKVLKKEQDKLDADENHFIQTLAKTVLTRTRLSKNYLQKTDKNPSKVISSKKTPARINLGFKGLIQQRKERSNEKPDIQKAVFADLISKEKTEIVLTKTSICRSILTNKRCYHSNCRYAHSVNELKVVECRFGEQCMLVKKLPNEQYINFKTNKAGKYCHAVHPCETSLGYSNRMGYPYTEQKASIKPVQIQNFEPPLSIDTSISSITHNIHSSEMFQLETKCELSPMSTKMSWADLVSKATKPYEKQERKYFPVVEVPKHIFVQVGDIFKAQIAVNSPDNKYYKTSVTLSRIDEIESLIKPPPYSEVEKNENVIEQINVSVSIPLTEKTEETKSRHIELFTEIDSKQLENIKEIDSKQLENIKEIDQKINKKIEAEKITDKNTDVEKIEKVNDTPKLGKTFSPLPVDKSKKTIIRCTKKNFEKAFACALNNGFEDFEIEFID